MDRPIRNAWLAFGFFLSGMLAWPSSLTAPVLPAMFLSHGMLVWRLGSGRLRDSAGWCLLAVLVAAWRMPALDAVLWSLSLCLAYPLVRLVLPGSHFRLYTPFGIEKLMSRLVLPACLLSALLQWAGQGGWGVWLSRLLLCWMALLLMAATLLARDPPALQRKNVFRLALVLVLIFAIMWHWGEIFDVQLSAIMLLPVLLFVTSRSGTVALAVLLSAVLLVLSLFAAAGLPGWQILQTPQAALTLALCCGLLSGVAVMGDLHRRRERLLRDVRAQFESLLNQSSSLMTLKGRDGRYLLVNLNFARLFDRPVPYFKGKHARDVFTPADASRIDSHDQQVLHSLEARQFEEELTIGGRAYLMWSNVFPLFDSDGLPAGVGSISVDITQRVAEESLRREESEKYRAVVEQSLVGIYILQDEKLLYFNPKLAMMLGYTEEQLRELSVIALLAPGEAPRFRAQLERRLRENIPIMHYSMRLQHRSGELLDVEIHSRLLDYQGRPATIGVVMDISDRVAAGAELRLAATVFENATEGILVTDRDGCVIMVNQAFTRITGFTACEAIGKTSRMLKTANQERNKSLIDALQHHGSWKGEMFDRRKNGEPYAAELSISAVRDTQGVLSHYVGVFSDITGRKQAEDRLQFLASHDPLTRLPNRSALIEEIDSAILASPDSVPRLALMFIDLDRFKLINDSFGHQAGDEVLHEISARLLKAAERFGMVARLGGDEFTLVVRDFDSHEALAHMAEDVLHALARPMHVESHEVFVSGSIGISVYPNDGIDASSLLKHADAAMYRAKEAGKNTYQFFDAQMNTQTFERLLMESGLRQALERDEFELHYQPQVAGADHRLTGVEALIRWRHPHLGLIPPVRFIPLAEETGLIKPIGAWVLREACRQMVAWDAQGLDVPRLAVNLSARQFEQQTLLHDVQDVLNATGLAASRLELEITESMLMQNPQEAVLLLAELKGLGVKLSVDDFGTGYSSLSTLKRFPLDYLKIDRSFIEGLPADEDSVAIAEAIIAMARKLHFTVIAEGVETAEQGRFLKESGCGMLQGYYFSKPLPAAQLADWVSGHRARGCAPD